MKKIYLLFAGLITASISMAQLPPLSCGSGTATVIYSQDFEGLFPSDWSKTSTFNPQWLTGSGFTSSGSTGPSAAFSNTGYLYLETSGGTLGDTDTLTAPSVNLTSTVDAARATFAYHMYGATMGSLHFEVSTDGNTWTELWSQSGQVQSSEAANWVEVEVDLTAYAGNILQMRFLGVRGSSFTSDMAIDIFLVEACISCFQPSGLNTTGNGTTTADLQWTAGGGETAWIIEYGPAGFTPGTGTTQAAPTNPYTVTGLIDNTNYDFYVYADCGGGDTSIPDGPINLSTDIVCCAPPAFSFEYTGGDTASVTWTPCALETAWIVEYGPTGYTPGTGTQTTVTILPDTTFGLAAGGIYDFYISSDCGGGLNNPWTGPITYVAPLTNDLPCNAISVPVDGSTSTFANVGATEDVGEPTTGFNTAWFTFVAPASGHVEIRTCGTDFDNMMELYSAPICSPYTNYNYIDGATGNTFTSCTGVDPAGLNACNLTPGNTYYLVVGGELVTDEGTFPLTLTEIPLVEAGTALDSIDVCEDNTAFDLFTGITGNDSQNGQWYNPTIAPGNEFGNPINLSTTPPGTYPFWYQDGNVCMDDQVMIDVTVHPIPNVGTGGIINSVCNNWQVNLYTGLNGPIDTGGEWHDINGDDIGPGIVNFNGELPGIYKYYYFIDNGGCPADSTPVNVQLIECLSVDEFALISDVYPNPVEDQLTVEFSQFDGNTTIQLVGLRGELITAPIVVASNKAYVDMTGLAKGVYFLRVQNSDKYQTVRVIKQ